MTISSLSTQAPDFVAVELPYLGGNLALVVIQPADLAAFEANLTAAQLLQTKTNIEALEPLHEIGLPTEYDFSAMIEGGDSGYFIDSISHVARIEVDETGTTAGAATDVAIAASQARPSPSMGPSSTSSVIEVLVPSCSWDTSPTPSQPTDSLPVPGRGWGSSTAPLFGGCRDRKRTSHSTTYREMERPMMAGPEELLDPVRFREFYDRVLPVVCGYL